MVGEKLRRGRVEKQWERERHREEQPSPGPSLKKSRHRGNEISKKKRNAPLCRLPETRNRGAGALAREKRFTFSFTEEHEVSPLPPVPKKVKTPDRKEHSTGQEKSRIPSY